MNDGYRLTKYVGSMDAVCDHNNVHNQVDDEEVLDTRKVA